LWLYRYASWDSRYTPAACAHGFRDTHLRDGQVVITMAGSGALQRLPWPFYLPPVLAFSPDGKLLLAGDDRGGVRLWPAELCAPRAEWQTPGGAIRCMDFSPDGKLLATGGEDGKLRLWNVADLDQPAPLLGAGPAWPPKERRVWTANQAPVGCLAFSA